MVLLLEDFGDVLLSNLLNDQTVDAYYEQSFKQLIQLQSIPGEGQFPAYSYEKLISEMELLTDWMLPALKIQPTESESALIKRTLRFWRMLLWHNLKSLCIVIFIAVT